MASALPLILAAGAAAVLLGKKKKKKKAPASEYVAVDIPAPPPVKTKGPSGATASQDVWAERQRALAYLNGIGFCNCDPGGIDGKFGSATRNAIMGFQDAAGIGVDGKWGKNTETAMASILSKAGSGLVKVPKKAVPAPAPKPSEKRARPQISIANDTVITSAGHRYNLNAFSVPNLYFCDNDRDCFGPAGIEKGTSGLLGTSIPEQFDAWGGRERFVTFWIGRNNYSDLVPVIEIARDLALNNPDLFFAVVINEFYTSNSVNLQNDVNDVPGRGVIHHEKFGSMYSMNLTDTYEYKKKLEQIMWTLLAGLRSKARW